MKKSHLVTGKDSGIIIHIAMGVLLTLICALLLSMLLTIIIENETVDISAIPAFIIAIHVISVFAGSMLSLTLEKGRMAIVAGIVGAVYLIILLCINMLIFSSGFDGFGAGIIGVLAGGILSILIKSRFAGQKKQRVKVRSR